MRICLDCDSIAWLRRSLWSTTHCHNGKSIHKCVPSKTFKPQSHNNHPTICSDALLKSAFSLIGNVPEQVETPDGRQVPSEPELVQIVSSFCALLVAVPGDPEHGPFYLFRGLLGAVHQYAWAPHSSAPTTIYLRALAALSGLAQSPLPYRARDVPANDTLYAGASEYHSQLRQSCDALVKQLLDALAETKNAGDAVRQTQLAAAVFGYMSTYCRLTPVSSPHPLFELNLIFYGLLGFGYVVVVAGENGVWRGEARKAWRRSQVDASTCARHSQSRWASHRQN